MSIISLFDRSFFKFLIGFTVILSLSFTVLFFVGRTMDSPENIDMSTQTATNK